MVAVQRVCRRWLVALVLPAALLSGCASRQPYRYGEFAKDGTAGAREVTVDYGKPHKKLDRMSDIVSWPRRKLRPGEPDKREITPETIERLTRYLRKNQLEDVYVSVRDYQPRDQWRRLRQNKVVPPLSRYSLGTLSVLRYSLLPGRVFGRNGYNPYTNSLYLNSDSPAVVLQEAAFAKNVHARPLPGVYAVASHVPFLSAWHELDSARDLVAYARAENDWQLEEESYREVYPRVGAEAVGGASALVPVWWGGPVLGIAGSAIGGVAGQMTLAAREREHSQEMADLVEGDVTGAVQQASYVEPVEETPRRRYVTPSRFQE